jgi:hypothetical protein
MAEFTPNRRFLVVTGTKPELERMRAAWPALGCVGAYNSTEEYPAYRYCLEYMVRAMAEGPFAAIGESGDVSQGNDALVLCDGRTRWYDELLAVR